MAYSEAYSQSVQKGQAPVCCHLCEVETKINWKCLNCDLLMCNKCKDKIHPKFKFAKDHKIIDIKEVGLYSKELDFTGVKCKEHTGQFCFMFCKSCDQLVCPFCISEIHNGHGLVEIGEGYKIQIDWLKEGQRQAKITVDELTTGEIKINEIRKVEGFKYNEAKKKIKVQNAALKTAVDQYTVKLEKELDEIWETLQNSITGEENKVIPIKKKIIEQNIKVENLINSNDVEKVFEEGKMLRKSMNENVEPLQLNFNSMPQFLPGELNQYNVGFLNVAPDLKLKITKQLTTGIPRVFYQAACLDGSLWISNSKVLQKVKPEGNNLREIHNLNINIYGMALTPSNDLLLITGESRLKRINGSTGELTDTKYSVAPLIPTAAVHVTSDNKVIIGATSEGKEFPASKRRVVIVMNKDGEQKSLIEHDRNNKYILTFPLRVTSASNGDICVVDKLSSGGEGRVVLLGQEGEVVNTYTGHSDLKKPFNPTYIASTPSDNIVVPDMDNHTIHILNPLGCLIKFYNTEDEGMLYPVSLSFNSTGKLYIGCSAVKSSSEMGKLFEVNIPVC